MLDIARRVADDHAADGRPRFVAGSMGPTTKSITVTGGVTFAELVEQGYGAGAFWEDEDLARALRSEAFAELRKRYPEPE